MSPKIFLDPSIHRNPPPIFFFFFFFFNMIDLDNDMLRLRRSRKLLYFILCERSRALTKCFIVIFLMRELKQRNEPWDIAITYLCHDEYRITITAHS